MGSRDGESFIKELAAFVRTNEKALANVGYPQRRPKGHRPTQSTGAVPLLQSPTLPERPSTASTTSSSVATTISVGALNRNATNIRSAKLALTPHHLFYLLSRFEELGIDVGPMKVRLENLHDSTSSANYVSFLSNTQRSNSHGSDAVSIRSVSSVRSAMSSMAALWSGLGIGASISAARSERQRVALQADVKFLYSCFTKLPSLQLTPDLHAQLIKGYEEFPFDSAVPLHAFKNLQHLEVASIDFRQFFGWDRLADQVKSLSLKRAGIEDPADILIDIVLDDMDKRRRRSSKAQSSPVAGWVGSNSPRRSSIFGHPELQRAATMPLNDPSRTPTAGSLNPAVGSLPFNEHAIEDGHLAENLGARLNDPSVSPTGRPRPRSISPSRSGSPRYVHNNSRSYQRMRRSGSGSSQSSLSDSWQHHGKTSSSNLHAMGLLPASKWRFLRHLSLADNAITFIPSTSLAPLSDTLQSLDLSLNLFSQMPDSLATLTALRALNMSHCMIDSLHSLLRNPLPAITALNLRSNRLSSLAGIEKLYPLERLDLRDNRLVDPVELARLTGIPDLREVWVDGNPFARTHRDYRVTIFNLFRKTPGYLEDISIDGTGPSTAEKRQLVERVPIPESVPVVKPINSEGLAITVGKQTTTLGDLNGDALVRKERPIPRAIMSEDVTQTTRRKKTPKRRIVDLSTAVPRTTIIDNTTKSSPTYPVTGDYKISSARDANDFSNSNNNPSVTGTLVDATARSSTDVKISEDRAKRDFSLENDAAGASWKSEKLPSPQAESLREPVGNDYLSLLKDQPCSHGSDLDSSQVPSAPLWVEADSQFRRMQVAQVGRTLS